MKLNKEFWEQVLLDYEDYTSVNATLISICGGSKLFKEVWGKQKDEIKLSAKEFLDHYLITNVELGTKNLLFVSFSYSYEVAVGTRKEFLNYMINERQEILD